MVELREDDRTAGRDPIGFLFVLPLSSPRLVVKKIVGVQVIVSVVLVNGPMQRVGAGLGRHIHERSARVAILCVERIGLGAHFLHSMLRRAEADNIYTHVWN